MNNVLLGFRASTANWELREQYLCAQHYERSVLAMVVRLPKSLCRLADSRWENHSLLWESIIEIDSVRGTHIKLLMHIVFVCVRVCAAEIKIHSSTNYYRVRAATEHAHVQYIRSVVSATHAEFILISRRESGR